jgi:NitT/TauT family transport system substrate-binding protein
VDAGTPEQMIDAFRAGEADYVHLQGPAPQQLEKDGIGHVVASVGEAIGPVAFSSLCSTRGWLASDMAQAFMRAYRKAQAWVLETPAGEIAKVEGPYFEGIDTDVLERTIAFYQQLGNWAPSPRIPRDAYEVILDAFAHSGLITRRHPYDAVVVSPPGS